MEESKTEYRLKFIADSLNEGVTAIHVLKNIGEALGDQRNQSANLNADLYHLKRAVDTIGGGVIVLALLSLGWTVYFLLNAGFGMSVILEIAIGIWLGVGLVNWWRRRDERK